MIEVRNLTKYYGLIKGIEDISFDVQKGDILGFLGPNGAGKSTTMRILTCYMPATSGTASVAGYDVFTQSLQVRKRVGYMPENISMYNEMLVESFLRFVAEIKGVPKKERDKHLKRIMSLVDINDVKHRIIGNLSRGFKQRVGLAQAMIGDPEVLILDEPTIGLDPSQIIEIRNLIRELAHDRTIILCSHILPEVSMLCERVVIINKGHIVVEDTLANLNAKLKQANELKLQVEGAPEKVIAAIKAIPGVVEANQTERLKDRIFEYYVKTEVEKDLRKEIVAAIISNGWGLLELRSVEMTLEDIFVRLVKEEMGAA